MPIIVDQRINPTALRKLEQLDEVIPFSTHGITYPAISGHPDIFFCTIDDLLIASEAVPDNILRKLDDAGVKLWVSKNRPGMQYPGSAIFNAVVTENYLIHRTDITEIHIQRKCKGKVHINVNQAYTRCNLLVPDERLWITSDQGIFKTFIKIDLHAIYIDPSPIYLEGFKHGFTGGCCGIWKQQVLIHGSLKYLKEEPLLRRELEEIHFEIVELYSGVLTDIGSILSVPAS